MYSFFGGISGDNVAQFPLVSWPKVTNVSLTFAHLLSYNFENEERRYIPQHSIRFQILQAN